MHATVGGCTWAGCTAGVGLFVWMWDCALRYTFLNFGHLMPLKIEKFD